MTGIAEQNYCGNGSLSLMAARSFLRCAGLIPRFLVPATRKTEYHCKSQLGKAR